MISENILKLRRRDGLSQEELAEKIGVVRQTVAKWESGDSLPDISSCSRMAELFNISVDDLVNQSWASLDKHGLPPKGKYIFGTVRMGDKGQIVIPARARRVFDIQPGCELIVLGDIEQGLALAKVEKFMDFVNEIQKKEDEMK